MSPRIRLLLAITPAIVLLDQLTKAWITANVQPHRPIDVIEGFFKITHARNPGAALGLFQGAPWWVFVVLTCVAVGLIAHYYRQIRPDDKLSGTALALILGGAFGNLIDRVRQHEVVDFLQFDLGLFIFPDFNVADSAIVVGVGLLLLDAVITESEQSAPAPDPPDPPADTEGEPPAAGSP